MNTLDIILLFVILIPGIWMGIRKGFIYQAVALIAIYAGAISGARWGGSVAQWISAHAEISPVVAKVMAFVLIFIAAYILLQLIGKVLQNILKNLVGGWLNVLAGIFLGVLKLFLFVGIVAMLFTSLNNRFSIVDAQVLISSDVYSLAQDFAATVIPFIKSLFQNGF